MMNPKLCFAVAATIFIATASTAAEPVVLPIPDAVSALKGCWKGVGEVMGKQVVVALNSKLILQDAMFTVDMASSAAADPKDRYSAHLIFGTADRRAAVLGDDIVGFWSDSFGGAYTALGRGKSRSHGFDITYQYPNDAFVNRWTISGGELKWSIVARHLKGVEKPFATYALKKESCTLTSP